MTSNEKALIELAQEMPSLSHWRDRSQPWAGDQSDVARWLSQTNAGANVLLQLAERAGAIVYDQKTKTWRGTGRNRPPLAGGSSPGPAYLRVRNTPLRVQLPTFFNPCPSKNQNPDEKPEDF